MISVSNSVRVEITGSGSVKNLKELLETIPEQAISSVVIQRGDRPFDPDRRYIEFKWTETHS